LIAWVKLPAGSYTQGFVILTYGFCPSETHGELAEKLFWEEFQVGEKHFT
jgi:hypothetical protein